MYYRRAPFPPPHLLDYLLLLLTGALLLGSIDSVTGKAIPLPFPFPAGNPPPDTQHNPPSPPGALSLPDDPLKNINKDWFLSYLTVNQPIDNCVFYCGITRRARDWVNANPPLRTIWETYPAFLFEDDKEPRKSFVDADTQAGLTAGGTVYLNRNRYAAMSSEAYAERCLGTTVHLLLDEVVGIPEQCIWNSEEKVALQREPNPIQKVIEITFEAGTITEKSRREYALAEDEPASPSSSPTGEPCAANPSPNGKRDLSCLASFSSTISTITPIGTSAMASPLCTFSVGEKGNSCICSDTITLPLAAKTGTNTGEHYDPCPMTTLPPTPTSMSSSATPRNTPQFAYTYTNFLNHDVIACESSSLGNYDSLMKETFCAGSSVTLTFAPSATVQVGKKQQNVGTLSGTALYTSISSALNKICPTATGNWASCSTTTVAIKQIVYIEGDTTRGEDGELVVSVQSSSYNDTKLRDAMIKSAALTAQTSANSTNCYETKYTTCVEGKGGECLEEKMTLCNAAGFAGVQYYDGAPVAATMWLDALWEFGVYSGGAFDCEVVIETLDAFLVEVAPEFAVEDVALGGELQAACQEVMEH